MANSASNNPPERALGPESGPLVWVDLEMTGLDARKDEIMEIAVSAQLNLPSRSLPTPRRYLLLIP